MIKILILLAFWLPAAVIVRNWKFSARQAIAKLSFITFFCLFSTFTINPNILTKLANTLGVGRGADLLIYFSVVFLFIFSLQTLKRFKKISEVNAILIRKIALIENKLQDE